MEEGTKQARAAVGGGEAGVLSSIRDGKNGRAVGQVGFNGTQIVECRCTNYQLSIINYSSTAFHIRCVLAPPFPNGLKHEKSTVSPKPLRHFTEIRRFMHLPD